MQYFFENISFPSSINCNDYFTLGTYDELDELLNYEWSEEKLQELVNKGVKMEVYLGANDKIVEASKAKEFFIKYASVYYIKDVGHILNR